MDSNSVEKKMTASVKWSGLAEIVAKLINPVSSMVLARLLTPEAFGVVATVNIIISFADMFTDAGFQKYIVQHEFDNEKMLRNSLNVAFWANLALSVLLWALICVFRNPLAALVGNPGLGHVLVFASAVLPVTAFSSLQTGYFRRKFNFKVLFRARLATVAVPLFVTIPLAFVLRTYWALVIGTLTLNLVNATILTISSDWKPQMFFSFHILKEMFSFSMWTLVEQFSIWLTAYIGTFIVGNYLSEYYVGVYKTAMTTVNNIMSLITSATLPVLFAGLSRLQSDREEFNYTFLRFQKVIAFFVLPMSVGIFLYRELVTTILLGNQWKEAIGFVGLWALMSGLTIVFGYYSSEVYRALGKPKLSVLSQALHLIVLIPVLVITAEKGFYPLYIARSLVRVEAILVDLVILWVVIGITPWQMITNIKESVLATVVMSGIALLLQRFHTGVLWDILSIGICATVYFGISCISAQNRAFVKDAVKKLMKR